MNSPALTAERAKRWMIETALPFWASAGIDHEQGGFHERLHPDGTPDRSIPKRVRVQIRQVFVFALAAYLGWCEEGHAIAMLGFDYLMAKAYRMDGQPGIAHLLTQEGSMADASQDSCDQVFWLLALAWLAKIDDDARLRQTIDETLAFLDRDLTYPDGSLRQGAPDSLPRRQLPHMHGFEAMLALHEALEYPGALARAERFHALCERHFIDAKTNTLIETFGLDMAPRNGWEKEPISPGLQAEWCWMIRRFDRLSGRSFSALPSALLSNARLSADPERGLLRDEANRTGKAMTLTCRTWPQTELVKAWTAEAEAGRTEAAGHAARAIDTLFAFYLNRPLPGGWVDQIDASQQALPGPIPASTLYHLIVAVAEADRVLKAA